MTDTATFLLGSTVVAGILINIVKKWIKEIIGPRFGDLGVQIFLLIVAISFSLFGYAWQLLPVDITAAVGVIFAGAMVLYQVFYKAVYQKAFRGKLDELPKP